MDPIVESLLAYKGAAILLWLAFFFLAERLRPAAPQPSKAARSSAWRATPGCGWPMSGCRRWW